MTEIINIENAVSANNTSYIAEIKKILSFARDKAYYAINSAMVEAYWQIGRRIVEEEQHGKERADYGAYIVKTLSKELTAEFGKGFSERSIWQFRQFYQMFPEIEIMRDPLAQSQSIDNKENTIPRALLAESQNADNKGVTIVRTLFAQSQNAELSPYLSRLNWGQIQRIMRVSNPDARAYYIKETAENMWSSRTLDRNISTLYYQRLLSSQIKEPVIAEMEEKTRVYQLDKFEFIKSPSVLEFLALPNNQFMSECTTNLNVKRAIIRLSGFCFVPKQTRQSPNIQF